jgi:hypothetical protein
MNTQIEIHDNNTNETGTFKVWFKLEKELKTITLSETAVNSLLTMRQKESFFIGKFKFKITETDFKELIKKLNDNSYKIGAEKYIK